MSTHPRFAIIAAVNDDAVFSSNLGRSPDLPDYKVYPMRGHASASAAYNAAIDSTDEGIMVFLHQDIYLPAGWIETVAARIEAIEATDPNWGVLGVLGVDLAGRVVGETYSSGLRKVVGQRLEQPVEVQSLDEIVLIVRRASGIRFDSELPGFHLYGTDICQIAWEAGKGCYAIDAFCIHNSCGIYMLPGAFWKAYKHLARKWALRCPLRTPCVSISPKLSALLKHRWYDLRRHLLRGSRPGERLADPVAVFETLQR
jgi:hypothetical protein